MPTSLDNAQVQLANGEYKKAVNSLWAARMDGLQNLAEARMVVEIASTLHGQTSGRLQHDCVLLVEEMNRAVARLERDEAGSLAAWSEGPYRDAIAVVSGCRVLGGHGLSEASGRVLELIFMEDRLRLRDLVGKEDSFPYADVTAIEIGGPGATRTGGGFVGGGFGLQGAAEGMLIASALNMLTTRTTIDTVICLQTKTAELFFHHTEMTPDALRIRLSRVFTILRQLQAAPQAPSHTDPSEHAVDRLAKLADLLDRGLISEDEFKKLKSDLLSP